MGAAPDVLKVAHEMAVMGRQGDPRELKGVRTSSGRVCSFISDVRRALLDLSVPRERRVDVHDWSR